jgi:hypothetical protein
MITPINWPEPKKQVNHANELVTTIANWLGENGQETAYKVIEYYREDSKKHIGVYMGKEILEIAFKIYLARKP